MIKFISKRLSLFLLASMLIGMILITVSHRAAAQGGFGYMCDAWEEYCDDGSGDFGGGGTGSGGGSSGSYYCPDPTGCGDFGCSGNGSTQVCVLYKLDPNSPGTCPATNCKWRN
ncbi:MAG: hypothetical protein QOC96_2416 [Acidobacteriota bacterium]|jgi:hypothetical protein|nr:hypothetical protein [Acidobacteriota bacterium]